MRSDLTDITLVVDRSGSMQDIQADAQGGVNAFVEQQAQQPGEAYLTLVQFDTEYEFVHQGIPIREVPEYQLVPRGMTALLDAVGRAINETGARLAAMDEQDRPGLVVFVIMTDGLENSSREFTRNEIRRMIQDQQDKYSWHFTFLGADQDAFAEAHQMGMADHAAANFAKSKVAMAWGGTASKVSRMRGHTKQGKQVVNEFTDEEREQMQ